MQSLLAWNMNHCYKVRIPIDGFIANSYHINLPHCPNAFQLLFGREQEFKSTGKHLHDQCVGPSIATDHTSSSVCVYLLSKSENMQTVQTW